MNSFRVHGQSGYRVLASCLGRDTGGGLFLIDRQKVEMVDRLSTTGLAVAGDRLLRLLWSSENQGSVGELLVYDAQGVERYYRVDRLREPHDVAWNGAEFIVVSTATNSILWISPAGEITRTWQAPGEGDCWHLNGLLVRDRELLVSAFGRFQKHREWEGHKKDGSGVVFNLTSGRDVLTGLHCPHTPRFFDAAWVIANSASGELLQINAATSAVDRRLQLQRWTRGIAVCDDLILVGESADRADSLRGVTASVAVVCRRTWTVLERVALPCNEVYDLAMVPPSLAEGVRRGFRTNPLRMAEQEQYALFQQVGVEPARLWATSDPLPRAACKARIQAACPATLPPDAWVELDTVLENLGTAILVSAPPYPVHVSYRWLDPSSGLPLPDTEGERSQLSHALPPRQSQTVRLKVRTPAREGEFILRVTLVQEHVAWFDELDRENCFEQHIRIAAVQPARSGKLGSDRGAASVST